MQRATVPMEKSTVQVAFRKALLRSQVSKRASVHTLRPSYATHLLEAGVNLRLIQLYLGHGSPSTTSVHTHITARAKDSAYQSINELMGDL